MRLTLALLLLLAAHLLALLFVEHAVAVGHMARVEPRAGGSPVVR
jgi:hypothetical protein